MRISQTGACMSAACTVNLIMHLRQRIAFEVTESKDRLVISLMDLLGL